MSAEISEYLTQNVPPKPQQTSALGSSVRRRPATESSSLRAGPARPARAAPSSCHDTRRRRRNEPDLLDAEHVGEERDELVGAARQVRSGVAQGRVARQEGGIVQLQHPAARARWDDDVVEAAEGRDDRLGDGEGVGAIAPVEAGCPQQVCASGTLTRQPASTSSLTAVKPTVGRTRRPDRSRTGRP